MRFLLLLSFITPLASAMELEGFLTKSCQKHTGMIVHVGEEKIHYLGLDGRVRSLDKNDIQTLFVFDVIENPISTIEIDETSLPFLKSVTLEDAGHTQIYAFPVRFIDDLLIFYSLDGKTRVQTYADIFKLRPVGESMRGPHATANSKPTKLIFSDASSCNLNESKEGVRPTRILADQISISEFLGSREQGYEKLDGFQERTYLYAKPFLYQKKARLGIVFQGEREEPGITFPVYFQWSTGQPYRFQSFSVVGSKSHEFTPTTEPVLSLRSDVKSHIFHAMFIGNVAGMPAGNSMFKFDGDFMQMSRAATNVQPNFNYMALMGADYGPWTLSGGLYFPSFGIHAGDRDGQYREVLASTASYLVRLMYTMSHLRLRVIGSVTNYGNNHPLNTDIRVDDNENSLGPTKFSFDSVFIRPGIDYEFSERLKVSGDLILVNGSYSDTFQAQDNSLKFNKMTLQGSVQKAFGDYVSISAFVNFIQNNYDGQFANKDISRNQSETKFFGAFEFIF